MTPDSPIRAIVVDDDALARRRLQSLLSAHPDVVTIRECAGGAEAIDALTTLPVELVFLDVQMPDVDGFEVLSTVGAARMPPVIFTSAYSEFAVRAFEAYALDYLLKPFDEARLAGALERARHEVGERRARSADKKTRAATTAEPSSGGVVANELDARLIGLLDHLQRSRPPRFPDALAIKTGSRYVVVRAADIDWIEADGNYSRVYVRQRPQLLTKSLAALERDVLDPEVFVRVHRSAVVNTTRIAAVEPHVHGELTLVLHDGTKVECSRRCRRRLEEKLYFTT